MIKHRLLCIIVEEVSTLPELSRFYNIAIKMIYSDNDQHHKPHFHVYYAEYTASVGIDGELIAGSLPVKQLRQHRTIRGARLA